jgi:hypothetical protein
MYHSNSFARNGLIAEHTALVQLTKTAHDQRVGKIHVWMSSVKAVMILDEK